jgi:diketogulonate reductase-like aldo/keto reductase
MDLGLSPTIEFRGVSVPTVLYGTAWKEGETARLVAEALEAGFRGIDTANQRKHYYEADVGRAVCSVQHRPFLQTKFTYARGQDHRLPYDPSAPPVEQVRQSFASSRSHLGVDTLDSYLLHGPEFASGISATDWAVWREMEALYDEGKVRLIGISNVSVQQVRALVDGAGTLPAFVQNRCYAPTGFDAAVRQLCEEYGIVYQGFSLLTANRPLWGHRVLHPAARRLGCTPAQVLFRYAMHLGILPLTGTADPAHMRADLACSGFTLDPDEQAIIAAL